MRKELKELVREAEKQGWTVAIAKGGHLKWRSPVGKLVVTCQTPSDQRAVKNIVRDLKRLGFTRRKK